MDKTIDTRRTQALSKEEIEFGNDISDFIYQKPTTRLDCLPGGWNSERPCPFVSCKHHIMIEVNQTNGGLKLHIPLDDFLEGKVKETCCLDFADYGGMTLEQVGQKMNVTRERIRQIEAKAMKRVRRINGIKILSDSMAEIAK